MVTSLTIVLIIHPSGGEPVVVDIYQATFTDTEVNNCFSIYHKSWITSRLKSSFICDNIPTKAILFFFSCSEVNSTWLITNQHACKVLFTCVVYTDINTMAKDSYYREMMIICNFKGEIFFKSKQLQSQCSVLPIGACTQEIVTNTFSAIKPLSQCPLV